MKTFNLIGYFICWAIAVGGILLSVVTLSWDSGIDDGVGSFLAVLLGVISGILATCFTRSWWALHWISICSGLAVLLCSIIVICTHLDAKGFEVIWVFIASYFALIGLFTLGAGIFGRLIDSK